MMTNRPHFLVNSLLRRCVRLSDLHGGVIVLKRMSSRLEMTPIPLACKFDFLCVFSFHQTRSQPVFILLIDLPPLRSAYSVDVNHLSACLETIFRSSINSGLIERPHVCFLGDSNLPQMK